MSLLIVFSTSGSASAGDFKLTTGIDVSSGDYGEAEATDMVVAPLTIAYSSFPWKFSANINYFEVSGPGDITLGIDGIIAQNTATATQISGFGDLSLSATWSADSRWDIAPFFLDLTAKLKFPTADENSGLSTGKTDTQFQADLAWSAGSLTPLATLGVKFSGGADYQNQLMASAGFNYLWTEHLNAGVFFDFRGAATASSDSRREMFAYLTRSLNSHFYLTVYGVSGFSNASPDWGAGLTLTIK
ncbi:MAG: hypothetical protein ACWA44_12555 [Thiotrichales bacterium]